LVLAELTSLSIAAHDQLYTALTAVPTTASAVQLAVQPLFAGKSIPDSAALHCTGWLLSRYQNYAQPHPLALAQLQQQLTALQLHGAMPALQEMQQYYWQRLFTHAGACCCSWLCKLMAVFEAAIMPTSQLSSLAVIRLCNSRCIV
jgi:hypothetical protein